MLDQTFTLKNLKALRKRIDGPKYGQKPESASARLSALADSLADGTFVPAKFGRRVINGYSVYSTAAYEDAMVVRKVNDNLRRLYKLRQSDRTRIVRQVGLLLLESCPKSILRLDIKSFYESLDRQKLLKRIGDDALLATRSKRLLGQFFDSAFPGLNAGLPRGLSVSATLAEFAMRDFDAAVRKLPNVYFYARYVDDMILFTFGDPEVVKADVIANLPEGLSLNEEKTRILRVQSCRCELGCTCPGRCKCTDRCLCKEADGKTLQFDFLGYKFLFRSIARKSSKSELFISMADKKVAKTKTRIIRALVDFAANNDFDLLRDRIRFLASNHELKASNNDRRVRSGIYYSYRLLSLKPDTQKRMIPPIILELDHFLHAALYARNNAFGQRISAKLNNTQKQTLQRISFRSGFCSRRIARFPSARIKELKECWTK